MTALTIRSVKMPTYSVWLGDGYHAGWSVICETIRESICDDRTIEDSEIDLIEAGEDDLCEIITVRGVPVATIETRSAQSVPLDTHEHKQYEKDAA